MENKKNAIPGSRQTIKNPPPANAVVLDAGQFHGSIIPDGKPQKHAIVRGKISGTGWAVDGHTLTLEIEKDGDIYYLNDWPKESDEAVMKTMHANDVLYQDTPLDEFAELWKSGEYEPEGRFFFDRGKGEVLEVVKVWDK